MKKLLSLLLALLTCISVGIIFSSCGEDTAQPSQEQTSIPSNGENADTTDSSSNISDIKIEAPKSTYVYSPCGEEDMIRVYFDKEGKIINLFSVDDITDPRMSDDDKIAEFNYGNDGKMLSVFVEDTAYAVTEYDNGKPTKTESENISFSYDAYEMTLTLGSEKYTFDGYGRCIHYLRTDDDGSTTDEHILTFDGNVGKWTAPDDGDICHTLTYENNIRLVILDMSFREEENTKRIEYEYNEIGSPVKVTEKDTLRGTTMYSYEYDESENVTNITEYQLEGETLVKKEELRLEYDQNGNNTKSTKLDGEGNIESVGISEYRESGSLLKRIHTEYKNGVEYECVEICFDESERITKRTTFEYPSGSKTIADEYIYEYHSNGNRSKETYVRYQNGVENERREYNYDENGNKIN